MAIAAGPVLAFGTVVLGFSFSIVFTVHQDKGSLIRFFLGVTLQDTSSSFDMSSGSFLTAWLAIGRGNCIWHGERNEFISGTSVTYVILHLFVSRKVFWRFWCLDLVAPDETFVWSWNECPNQPFADDGFLLLSVLNFNACSGFAINVNDFWGYWCRLWMWCFSSVGRGMPPGTKSCKNITMQNGRIRTPSTSIRDIPHSLVSGYKRVTAIVSAQRRALRSQNDRMFGRWGCVAARGISWMNLDVNACSFWWENFGIRMPRRRPDIRVTPNCRGTSTRRSSNKSRLVGGRLQFPKISNASIHSSVLHKPWQNNWLRIALPTIPCGPRLNVPKVQALMF